MSSRSEELEKCNCYSQLKEGIFIYGIESVYHQVISLLFIAT